MSTPTRFPRPTERKVEWRGQDGGGCRGRSRKRAGQGLAGLSGSWAWLWMGGEGGGDGAGAVLWEGRAERAGPGSGSLGVERPCMSERLRGTRRRICGSDLGTGWHLQLLSRARWALLCSG